MKDKAFVIKLCRKLVEFIFYSDDTFVRSHDLVFTGDLKLVI